MKCISKYQQGGETSAHEFNIKMEEIVTKVCTACGKEKPLSDFGKCSREKDGHLYRCKECTNKQQREYGKKKRLKKVFTNPDLASFQPRELIAELRARGYTGELVFTQRITV